jgi:NADPH2:quinone reductase
MQAIILQKIGGPENLKIQEVPDPKPKKNEVVVKHQSVGVNFFDVGYRNGHYKMPKVPAILGCEGCGIITEIGSDVKDYKVGQKVAYINAGIGSYAEKKSVNTLNLITIPDNISHEQISASFLKGLMAHTLLNKVYLAGLVKRILIHSATSGVGHILCQWAKNMNIEIIGTVGSDEKIDYARSIGCNYVINYKTQNFVEEVGKITDFNGVGIVYDSIGKETLSKSLECLWATGICISYGDTSGHIENFNLNELVFNSLFITRPTLARYKSSRIELVVSANALFEGLSSGIIRPKITSYKFEDVAKAHADIESKKTMGSSILVFP